MEALRFGSRAISSSPGWMKHVLRPVEPLLDGRIAALPVGGRQVARQRVVGVELAHRPGDGHRRERVVGWGLDEGVAAGHGVADDGHPGEHGAVAGHHVHGPGPEGAGPLPPPVDQALLDPALEVLDADGALHQLPHEGGVEPDGQ
jgi:hypothetical protein